MYRCRMLPLPNEGCFIRIQRRYFLLRSFDAMYIPGFRGLNMFCACAERFAGPSAFSSLPAETSSMLAANNSNQGYACYLLLSAMFVVHVSAAGYSWLESSFRVRPEQFPSGDTGCAMYVMENSVRMLGISGLPAPSFPASGNAEPPENCICA